MKLTNRLAHQAYKRVKTLYGKQSSIERNTKNKILSVTWNKVGGFDGIIVKNDVKFKWHPYPAPVMVYAFKYFHVPELLIGPLKYASETIKIDEIDIPYKYARKYKTTGEKQVAKVTGSCASVIVSAITIKFVQDMITKYKNTRIDKIHTLYKIFRKEYDKRVAQYITKKTVVPKIPWLKISYNVYETS